jgi:hypothetical protein
MIDSVGRRDRAARRRQKENTEKYAPRLAAERPPLRLEQIAIERRPKSSWFSKTWDAFQFAL